MRQLISSSEYREEYSLRQYKLPERILRSLPSWLIFSQILLQRALGFQPSCGVVYFPHLHRLPDPILSRVQFEPKRGAVLRQWDRWAKQNRLLFSKTDEAEIRVPPENEYNQYPSVLSVSLPILAFHSKS